MPEPTWVSGNNPFSGWGLNTYGNNSLPIVTGGTRPNFSPVNSTSNTSTMIYPTNPTFPTSSNNSGRIDHYFNTVASLVSQWFTANGKNPTTQISPSGQITGIANPNLIAGYNAQTAQTQALAPYQGQQPGGAGNQAIGAGFQFLDGIAQSFGISTTSLLLFAGVGTYLLLREPPRRR